MSSPLRNLLLPLLLLLAGCEDYTKEIETVKAALVRDAAASGEKGDYLGKETLGEYVRTRIVEGAPIAWSAEMSTLADGSEGVVVIAEVKLRRLVPETKKVNLHFRVDPSNHKVAFLVMEADGRPILRPSGKPYDMSSAIGVLRKRWIAIAGEPLKRAIESQFIKH